MCGTKSTLEHRNNIINISRFVKCINAYTFFFDAGFMNIVENE